MSIGLINYLLVSVLTTIANKIAPSNTIALIDHGFCSRVNRVLFEILINYLLVSVLTPIAINEIAPGNTGVRRATRHLVRGGLGGNIPT